MSLEGPSIVVSASPSRTTAWSGFESLDKRALNDARATIARTETYVGQPLSLAFCLSSTIPEHVGLGSKTATILALLTAADAACSLGLSREELQMLSGRGGASGVGIHGFFSGGFILDAGHPQDQVSNLTPSSFRRPGEPPLMLLRLTVPPHWAFTLMLPRDENGLSGHAEEGFFRRNTPLTRDEVLESLSLHAYGISPAICAGDLELLGRSLDRISNIGFKRREIAANAASITSLLKALRRESIPAGLSSMGPLVFAVTSDEGEDKTRVLEIARQHELKVLGSWPAADHGSRVHS